MKKGFWRFGAIFALLLVFAACDEVLYEPSLVYEPPAEDVEEIVEVEDVTEYLATYEAQQETEPEEETENDEYYQYEAQPYVIEPPAHYFDVFSSGRTRGEYLYDLDYLYNTLSANFPFFGVIYRLWGVDMHELYFQTRRHFEQISDIRSDQEFANTVNSRFIAPARGAGHFDMLTGRNLQIHIEVFSSHVNRPSDQFLYFLYELDNPATRALHGLTDNHFAPPLPGDGSFVFPTTSNNIEARIIEPGHIAYVNILQMNHGTMPLDREKLLEFYHYISNFDHLIIDIRQNDGGDTRFFPELVIAPNISEPLEYYFYMFIMGGEHNRRLLETWFGPWWNDGLRHTIADGVAAFVPVHDDLFARLTYLDPGDADILDHYWTWHEYIAPSHGDAIFGGKIWLLVSERNFSASEQAAAISHQTGFATLVGQATRGDGIGINPLVLALPNTGMVVRYSAIYGVDPLGRNNQEFGTSPHIFNRPNRSALQTVLELIAEGNY